jgi:hypothetical protein
VKTGNPVAGIIAGATVLLLDTGTGRKIIRQVGKELFDDVLGLDPQTALAFSSELLHKVVTLGLGVMADNFSDGPPLVKSSKKELKTLAVDMGKKLIKYYAQKYEPSVNQWLEDNLGLNISQVTESGETIYDKYKEHKDKRACAANCGTSVYKARRDEWYLGGLDTNSSPITLLPSIIT